MTLTAHVEDHTIQPQSGFRRRLQGGEVGVRKRRRTYRVGGEQLSSNPLADVSLPVSAFGKTSQWCAYESEGIWVYGGNCLEILDAVAAQYPEGCFDMIFADPPYFLSNGGITCHAGRMVKVDKGDWDKSQVPELNHEFNLSWLGRCQKVLKPNGTIWVTGTHHVIFSIGYAMQQLGMKILNSIAWEKPNPPPNLSCRYFTHSTEMVIWAAKSSSSRHCFNYDVMRAMNMGRQMKTVWTIPPPGADEKRFGKHPTQKPVALVERCLLASTDPGNLVLDPFSGSGTTAVACIRLGRRHVGIELDKQYLTLAQRRIDHELTLRRGSFIQNRAPASAVAMRGTAHETPTVPFECPPVQERR